MTIEIACQLYTSSSTYNSLDTILSKLGVTHEEFRQHCKANNLTMPELSVGLAEELECMTDKSKRQCCIDLVITMKEYDKLKQGDACRNGTKINTKDLSGIILARRQGRPVAEIALEYNISSGRVYQLTNHIARGERKSRTSVKLSIKIDMAKKRKRGASIAELAKAYNLTPNTVYVYLRDVGSITLNDN